MASACTHNCNQGRACSCAPVVIPTRPSLLARLRRWWHLRRLREELAGLEEEHAAVYEEICELTALHFQPGQAAVAKLAQSKIEMRRLELLDITRRHAEALARLQAAEGAA